MWSLQANKVLTNLQGHEGWIKSLAGLGSTLFSGSHDETIRVCTDGRTLRVANVTCLLKVLLFHSAIVRLFQKKLGYHPPFRKLQPI